MIVIKMETKTMKTKFNISYGNQEEVDSKKGKDNCKTGIFDAKES